MGKVLKKQGNPVGHPHQPLLGRASTYWSVAWSQGAKVLEADGKTPAINSDKTAQVIEWYKELYKDAMEPEVLSWDDAGNNRFILSGKGSWIHNPVSPYNAALDQQACRSPTTSTTTIARSGPAGTHSAPPDTWASAIWKFSKNQELAKEFIQFLFQKENFDAWIVASNAFNHPPLKHLADHPIWAQEPQVRHAAQGGRVRASARLAGQAERGRPAHRQQLHHGRHGGQGRQRHADQARHGLGRRSRSRSPSRDSSRPASMAVGPRVLEAAGLRRARPPLAPARVVGAGAGLRLRPHPPRPRAARRARRLPVRDGHLLQPLRLLGRARPAPSSASTNYRDILGNETFRQTVQNSFVFTAIALTLKTVLGVWLAMLLPATSASSASSGAPCSCPSSSRPRCRRWRGGGCSTRSTAW